MKKFITTYQTVIVSNCILILYLASCMNAMAQDKVQTITWKKALDQDPAWYANAEATRIADNVLLYQHQFGGWPKNIDMAKKLNDEDIKEIRKKQADRDSRLNNITIDNHATHTQIRYLARVYSKTGHERFKKGCLLGIDYLLEAQYANGGWPQYYPLREGYYEHITFNDGAMIGVLKLLRETASGQPPFDFVDQTMLDQINASIDKGIEVILKTQIEVDGALTAWCAQHDATTLEPVKARSYELASISGSVGVGIVRFLMEIDDPDDDVIHAIKSAAAWFDKVKISDVRVIEKKDPSLPRGYDRIVGFDPVNATPLWGRFYEIGTNYPIFVDRDGEIQYALSEISYERRVGYRYLGSWANKLLEEEYPAWLEKINNN